MPNYIFHFFSVFRGRAIRFRLRSSSSSFGGSARPNMVGVYSPAPDPSRADGPYIQNWQGQRHNNTWLGRHRPQKPNLTASHRPSVKHVTKKTLYTQHYRPVMSQEESFAVCRTIVSFLPRQRLGRHARRCYYFHRQRQHFRSLEVDFRRRTATMIPNRIDQQNKTKTQAKKRGNKRIESDRMAGLVA